MSSQTILLDLDSSSSSEEDIFIAALLACEEEEEELLTLCLHDSPNNRPNGSDEESTSKLESSYYKISRTSDNKRIDNEKIAKGLCHRPTSRPTETIKMPNDDDCRQLNATDDNRRISEQRKLHVKKKKRKNNETNDNVKKKSKRMWVKYTNETRYEFGEFRLLFPDLLKDENKFFQYFKMSSKQFYELLHMLQPEIESINTQFRQPVSGEEKLSVTLRFLVTGDSFRSISDGYKLGQSTVRNAIYQVCDLIQEKVMPLMIPTPHKRQWEGNEEVFRNKYNFPNCVGVLAGRHVMTERPPATGSQYFNYRKSFSTILLALIDPNYKFMVIDIQDFGKIASDNIIFTNSELGRKFLRHNMDFPDDKPLPGTSTPMPHVIVADEAFPLSRNIMRSFPRGQALRDETKKIYNSRLNHVKEVSEKCFDLMTKRFRVYERKLNIQPENLDKVIAATCSLHNFLSDQTSLKQLSEEANPPFVRSIEILAKTGGGGFTGESLAVRNDFKKYFSSMNNPLPQKTGSDINAVQSLTNSPASQITENYISDAPFSMISVSQSTENDISDAPFSVISVPQSTENDISDVPFSVNSVPQNTENEANILQD